MNWKDWYSWKQRKLITAVLFILAYIVTIPIRSYEFLDGYIDTSTGIPIEVHLIIVIAGVILVIFFHWVIEIIMRRFFLKD